MDWVELDWMRVQPLRYGPQYFLLPLKIRKKFVPLNISYIFFMWSLYGRWRRYCFRFLNFFLKLFEFPIEAAIVAICSTLWRWEHDFDALAEWLDLWLLFWIEVVFSHKIGKILFLIDQIWLRNGLTREPYFTFNFSLVLLFDDLGLPIEFCIRIIEKRAHNRPLNHANLVRRIWWW